MAVSFDPFPVLETQRLRLRAITSGDAESIFRIQSDPEVTRYFGRPGDGALADSERRVAEIEKGVRENTSIRWGVTLRDGGEIIGSVGFWRWNKPHRWAEVGYDLLPAFWNQGIMSEAVRAVVSFGFASMDLHRVEAQLDPENRASARLLERLGFARDGLLRENWYYEGKFTDTAVYGLLRRDAAGAAA
ncbi:GNAT family acetyltransferase [Sorangium cellulosum]|uniref:GNAT family acetyltransferase n=1 Tax=Sorangium cellulosum TaxID=56 RepID=A0A2L0F0D0_SORCE|nr:GNAT family acetyltransferase [Sorangium cellulosum]